MRPRGSLTECRLNIQQIDTREADAQSGDCGSCAKLAPSGNVVSEAGRRKTIEVLASRCRRREVVERICCGCASRRAGGRAAVHGASSTARSSRRRRCECRRRIWRRPTRRRRRSFWQTIRRIRDNILRFQTAILHRDVEVAGPHGSKLRQRYLPLERVGICVPGGAAAYPSTVLMTAVPAQAAGVKEIVVVSPPTPNGAYNQDVLATCHELGIREVYRVGGAQGGCGAGVWRGRAWRAGRS